MVGTKLLIGYKADVDCTRKYLIERQREDGKYEVRSFLVCHTAYDGTPYVAYTDELKVFDSFDDIREKELEEV